MSEKIVPLIFNPSLAVFYLTLAGALAGFMLGWWCALRVEYQGWIKPRYSKEVKNCMVNERRKSNE